MGVVVAFEEARDPAEGLRPLLDIVAEDMAGVNRIILDKAVSDVELIPKRLRQKATADADVLAAAAEVGMRIIEREQIALQPPDRDTLDRIYARLKALHGEAHGWDPPDVEGLERLPSNRMRQYVRAWINEWDLRRLDPEFRPDTVVSELALDYREDAALDDDVPGDGGDDAP